MTQNRTVCPSCHELIGYRRARAPGRGPLLRLQPGMSASWIVGRPEVVILTCRCGREIEWHGDVAIRPKDAPVGAVV